MKWNSRSAGIGALYVGVGAIAGGLLGGLLKNVDALSGLAPYLASETELFSIAPFTLDLFVVQLTLGLTFAPNLMAALGMVLGLVAYRKF